MSLPYPAPWGIFTLITVNCAILGGSLLMAQRGYGFTESVVYGWLRYLMGSNNYCLAGIEKNLNTVVFKMPTRAWHRVITVGLISLGFMSLVALFNNGVTKQNITETTLNYSSPVYRGNTLLWHLLRREKQISGIWWCQY